MSNFFFYQRAGKESAWEMAMSADRSKVVSTVRPAFTTVLDLSGVPEDNDWSKVRYTGPFYVDFDADGDLELVCQKFREFLGKLSAETGIDMDSPRYYASGSKGFHIEIPQECFIPKPPAMGTPWLPYIYREMAQSLMVDTLDLSVYTGKRGRMWRTSGVKRENGCYKVPLTFEEAFGMTPDDYLEVIRAPRGDLVTAPAVCTAGLAMLFDRCKEKVTQSMRGKKKRQEKAHEVLAPWKKSKRTPPTVLKLMSGEDVADGAGFQAIAMQLAIYAISVDMPEKEFLDRCRGLVDGHVSDSNRYNTPDRRRGELSRMYEYMANDSLYDFDPGPIVRLMKAGTDVSDLGVISQEDPEEDGPKKETMVDDDGNVITIEPAPDAMIGVRGGIFQNPDGLFVKRGDEFEPLCRYRFEEVTVLENVGALDNDKFGGFQVTLSHKGVRRKAIIPPNIFSTAGGLRGVMVAYGQAYRGNDLDSQGILDMLNAKIETGGRRVYAIPREGLMVVDHPTLRGEKVIAYLTQDACLTSVDGDEKKEVTLRYRALQAVSGYRIDIHKADAVEPEHYEQLKDLFRFNRPDVVAKTVGWFVASHYRSAYIETMRQFPSLQVYGEAGSGKSQTLMLLARMHWASNNGVSLKAAMSCTNYALDMHATSSSSAPLIIDEWKPREMRMQKGKYEKLKELVKMAYMAGEVGERGNMQKGSADVMALAKSTASAPIAFMGEAVEPETAIQERCVTVALSQQFQTHERKAAFYRLQKNADCLSSLGRTLMLRGLAMNLGALADEVTQLRHRMTDMVPTRPDGQSTVPERLIYNMAVMYHAWDSILRGAFASMFGEGAFDAEINEMLTHLTFEGLATEQAAVASVSEISKAMGQIAKLSRLSDRPYAVVKNKDYLVDGNFVEVRVESCYDHYRMYCATIRDTPLFDSPESFLQALYIYSAVVDRMCIDSRLRVAGADERVMRFDIERLKAAGVPEFR